MPAALFLGTVVFQTYPYETFARERDRTRATSPGMFSYSVYRVRARPRSGPAVRTYRQPRQHGKHSEPANVHESRNQSLLAVRDETAYDGATLPLG